MTGALLLLDVGNSRVKWALVQAGEWIAEGAAGHDERARLFDAWDRFPPPARAVACNVAAEARSGPISAYWRARGVPLQWLQAARQCAGVRNLYAPPDRLGSDRWAALVGAWGRLRQACLVVSAGTAVTIDALNGRGEFIGGMILPGKRLMQASLSAGTHALQDVAGQSVDFPRNTPDAMASGIATALACAVHKAHQRLSASGPQSPPCLLSGGDAGWLAEQLPFGAIIAPRLVLEGLLIMTREDAQK